MHDISFQQAYQRGATAIGADHYRWHWRVHAGLWVAFCASKLRGDFVECGVNYGFLSSAIMHYLDWNSLDKAFYLLDTFYGLDERYVSEQEKKAGALEMSKAFLKSGHYVSQIETVKANFSEWRNVRIIEGAIPETLEQVETKEIAYLHLDMNCSPPEIAAAEFFWDRLVPGALVLMDDYSRDSSQKEALDAFVQSKGLKILSVPTGQGLLIKPV